MTTTNNTAPIQSTELAEALTIIDNVLREIGIEAQRHESDLNHIQNMAVNAINAVSDAKAALAAPSPSQQASSEPQNGQDGYVCPAGKAQADSQEQAKPTDLQAVPDVDELANFIRTIDGNHRMGAGALAENIVEWLAAAPTPPPAARELTDAWQPIETAPEVKGEYVLCEIAWGPEGDQSVGNGLRWQGRWFAAGTFHALGKERRYEFREIEVRPTHWRRGPDTPALSGNTTAKGE